MSNSTSQRQRRMQRVASGQIPFSAIPHGLGGYRNYGCPCYTCTTAGRADNRRATLARREKHGDMRAYTLWSRQEDAVVRRRDLTHDQVAELLPNRTRWGVVARRRRLGLLEGDK